MTDRITANLPSNDFGRTAAFYQSLGFQLDYKGGDWMIMHRGPLELEFFAMKIEPPKSCFSACMRVDDLDGLYADFSAAGVPRACGTFPNMSALEDDGMRMFTIIDPDGSLLRCIDNKSTK